METRKRAAKISTVNYASQVYYEIRAYTVICAANGNSPPLPPPLQQRAIWRHCDAPRQRNNLFISG